MARPEPSELDHRLSQPWVPTLGNALLAIASPALPRAWRQPCIGSDLAPVVEAAEQSLKPQERSQLRPDPAQSGQCCRCRTGGRPGGLREEHVALVLNSAQVRYDKLQPLHLAADLLLQAIRQGAIIPGLERVQARQPIPVQGIIVHDALAKEQPLDPVRVLDPLLEQPTALARQA